MKTKTITCHDVYNVGASLQAYALQQYIQTLGHENEIINYKPDYLRHYRLFGVNNPAYDKPILRELYQIAKFPRRLKALKDVRKKRFDEFTANYLNVTKQVFHSALEIDHAHLDADLLIAGSDQIWNPVFKNGRDPAFFLQFGEKETRKISYAASFAVDTIPEEYAIQMKKWLTVFDGLSVREDSGKVLLSKMGFKGQVVCDPVFLLGKDKWKEIAIKPSIDNKYVFVYDFDHNSSVERLTRETAEKKHLKIVTVFGMEGADIRCADMGPREFLGWLMYADTVISNSFHATAFSVIFEKNFYVVKRKEAINTRMEDFLKMLHFESRLIDGNSGIDMKTDLDWRYAKLTVEQLVEVSKDYLKSEIREAER